MSDVFLLLLHLLSTPAKLIRPGGSRTVIAENLLLKQQLIIHSRSRQRAPNLTTRDRVLLGFWSRFLNPRRIARSAIVIKPSTLLRFHSALRKRKYRQLYSPSGGRKPGPKGPSKEIINAIIEMKHRNPHSGCPRIAQQISLAFGLELDMDLVRRILATHYKPDPGRLGPSWLTTIGHAKDSLWSRCAGPVDLFRCDSILLKTHWVMVVMVKPPWNHAEEKSSISITIDGRDTAVVCLNYRWLLEIRFRQGQVAALIADTGYELYAACETVRFS